MNTSSNLIKQISNALMYAYEVLVVVNLFTVPALFGQCQGDATGCVVVEGLAIPFLVLSLLNPWWIRSLYLAENRFKNWQIGMHIVGVVLFVWWVGMFIFPLFITYFLGGLV